MRHAEAPGPTNPICEWRTGFGSGSDETVASGGNALSARRPHPSLPTDQLQELPTGVTKLQQKQSFATSMRAVVFFGTGTQRCFPWHWGAGVLR